MGELVRMSISIEDDLLERLDRLVTESRYTNRSEFIRDMIRDSLVQREWDRDEEVVGTLTLLYDHDARGLSDRLTDIQHDHHGCVLASTHVHLDRHLCAEMILLRGRAAELKDVADLLRQQKGVLHSSLSVGSTGASLA